MDAVSLYRLSSRLQRHGARPLASLIKGFSFFLYKASIPPELEAGENFKVGHRGFGVVIHERTSLGNNVHLNHNVTLATDIPPDDPRKLTVGNDVSFGTGAIVVGPITIGDHVVVGAGAVVVDDVPSNVTVAGVPARIVAERESAMPWLRSTGSDSD